MQFYWGLALLFGFFPVICSGKTLLVCVLKLFLNVKNIDLMISFSSIRGNFRISFPKRLFKIDFYYSIPSQKERDNFTAKCIRNYSKCV